MKTKRLTPEGFATVRTYMAVNHVDKQIDFLANVFNAVVKERLKNPEGNTLHGELVIDDSIIMIGRVTAEVKPIQCMCYVYVENADEVYARAIELGATSIAPPANQMYGNKEGGFKDLEGNTWWVSQFIQEVTPEEIEREIANRKLK